MAKASKSHPSVIAMLSRQRTKVFLDADHDSDGILTSAQQEQVNAFSLIIANGTAVSRGDAAAQVKVACELVELVGDGHLNSVALDAVLAALRSASRVLDAPSRRAA